MTDKALPPVFHEMLSAVITMQNKHNTIAWSHVRVHIVQTGPAINTQHLFEQDWTKKTRSPRKQSAE